LKHFLYIQCEKNEREENLEYMNRFSRLLESAKPQGFRFYAEIKDPSGYFIPPLPISDGLRKLFEGHKLPGNFQTNDVADIIEYYKRLSGEYGFSVDVPELMLTFEADKLLQQRKTAVAVGVCEYQLSLYPKALNALWRLGEIYRNLGEFERAREYYREFLKIRDVDASFVQNSLNRVEKIINESAAYRIEQTIQKQGIQAGLKKFREIKSDPNNALYFSENEFNAMGYRFMGSGKMSEAVEVFKMNVELYPSSANVYDSLGEAYMNKGDTVNAIKNYKRSLELNPENTNAVEMLKRLEKKQTFYEANKR
jgi:tetratricopeptide (TPR) repeat protein